MRGYRLKIARFVLAMAAVILAACLPASAVTNRATSLNFGELRTLAQTSYYSAASLFVLTFATPEQKTFVITKLGEDGSSGALEALAEIAMTSDKKDLVDQAFKLLLVARPLSADALSMIADFSVDERLKNSASKARGTKQVDLKDSEPPFRFKQLLDQIDLGFASGLVKRADDLKAIFDIKEDLTNGSRFVIQSWFLKRILSLQKSDDRERQIRFDLLLNEISMYLSRPVQVVKIETPGEFETFKSSLISPLAYLQDEMKFSKGLSQAKPIRLQISANMNEAVQAFSNSFRSFDQKIETLNSVNFFDLLANAQTAGGLFRLRLKAQSVNEKLAQLRELSNRFEQQYQSLQTVGTKLTESKAFAFGNPAEQRFFELLISHYFATFSFEETANVMKAVIERPDQQSGAELFHLMVMYAGPQMQKLLQVVARREGISPELSRTFQKLEDGGFSSAWERIGPNFDKPPVGTKWIALDRTARVGSMAETYKGKILITEGKHSGEEVTVAARSLKSYIRQRVEREAPRLQELARVMDNDPILRQYNFALVAPMMNDVMQMSFSELEVGLTTESQQTGERLYPSTVSLKNGVELKFVTPQTFESSNPDVIYSSWLKGEKFETFAMKDRALATEVAEATTFHWIETALFNERFFHADLHQGNIKILKTGATTISVGFLDFGMVGRLTLRERSTLIKLSLATARKSNAALIAKYLFELSDKRENKISLADLTKEARVYLTVKHDSELTMDNWINWGLSKGLKAPTNITAFGRGLSAIEQLMKDNGSKRPLAQMVKDVALEHKRELAPDLLAFLKDSVVSSVAESAQKIRTVSLSRKLKSLLRCETLFLN